MNIVWELFQLDKHRDLERRDFMGWGGRVMTFLLLLRSLIIFHVLPTACAVGCTLTPLPRLTFRPHYTETSGAVPWR
jgi:hypothetical protein